MSEPRSMRDLPEIRTAVLVTEFGSERALSPFFGKCDGILLIDGGGGPRGFISNVGRTSQCVCDLILAEPPCRLVCGFIGEGEKARLSAAGIEVRLGSCSSSVEALVARFGDLPKA